MQPTGNSFSNSPAPLVKIGTKINNGTRKVMMGLISVLCRDGLLTFSIIDKFMILILIFSAKVVSQTKIFSLLPRIKKGQKRMTALIFLVDIKLELANSSGISRESFRIGTADFGGLGRYSGSSAKLEPNFLLFFCYFLNIGCLLSYAWHTQICTCYHKTPALSKVVATCAFCLRKSILSSKLIVYIFTTSKMYNIAIMCAPKMRTHVKWMGLWFPDRCGFPKIMLKKGKTRPLICRNRG